MRKLQITITLLTDRPEQEVLDMLIDGHIDRAGDLKSIVIEDDQSILLVHRGPHDSVS